MRQIVTSPQFENKLVKFLKKNPNLNNKITSVFRALAVDIKHPILKSHKLHGALSNFFACTLTYEYRLIFYFDQNFVYLHAIGSHNDVY